MTSKLTKITTAVFALSMLSGVAFAGPEHNHAKGVHKPTTARVGEAAPDFTLTDQSGKAHKLSEYKGKTVILEWTNPRCPFVVRHYKAGTTTGLQKQFGGEKGEDIVWLRINSTNADHRDHLTAKETQAWAKEVGVNGPVLDDTNGAVGHLFGAKTTPHMYVINAKGILTYSGAIDDDPRGKKEKPSNFIQTILANYQSGKKVEAFANDSYGCSIKYSKK
ncbi:redoxin domain-containing protein [Gemmatimonas aurantiaca]|nr:redoxin domain-containing protein [Gemmatimonas aurantiaca]